MEEQRKRVEKFLSENYTGKYHISKKTNKEGKFEVSARGSIEAVSTIKNLATNDFVFTKVRGFCCRNCDLLQTLDGAPQEVETFDCRNCTLLKSLKGAPEKVEKFLNTAVDEYNKVSDKKYIIQQ